MTAADLATMAAPSKPHHDVGARAAEDKQKKGEMAPMHRFRIIARKKNAHSAFISAELIKPQQ